MARTFTISFPDELAQQVEQLAKQECRNTSELFREAFRAYRREQIRRSLDDLSARAKRNNSRSYSEEEVLQMVHEVRGRK
jgi:metal-responsive CopG/Arc/MetJ family transcriptional regulator